MSSVQKVIDTNAKFLDVVNQILHNAGVLFEKRIEMILELLHGSFERTPCSVRDQLTDTLEKISIPKEELFQKVFMLYGSKYLKKEFDQFYTPVTVGQFLCGICKPKKSMIDPACGTGDLVVSYTGSVTLWDISKDVTDLTVQNFAFQSKKATIVTRDSIQDTAESNESYEYAIVNPPFGTRTLVSDRDILDKYTLGSGKKKQEVGILFVERSMNLLKENGLMSIILPNGYFGNTSSAYVELRKFLLQFRVVGIIKLPQNTFKRSGTGVSTNILIVSKTRPTSPYDVFIEEVVDIGYELSKKNTPFKYRKNDDGFVLDSSGHPILQNDLSAVLERLKTFAHDHKIANIERPTKKDVSYQSFHTGSLDDDCILDISRYLRSYTGVVANTSDKVAIKDLLNPDYSCTFKKSNSEEYVYIDIKEINTPLHRGRKMIGHELPSRAKYRVEKNDLLVSRLKGAITFTVVMEDKENLVCTNGVCVLRPKDTDAMLLLFAGLFSSDFKIQHEALTTGSIMESISDEDLKNIVVPASVDVGRFRRILDSVSVLQTDLPQ